MGWTAGLKDGLRRVRRAPRLSVAVVACIGLGMAATAAVATLISLTSFRPLPFPDADRLVRIWNTEAGTDVRDELAWVDYTDLEAGMETLDALEATARSRLMWHLPDRAVRRVEGEAVSSGYFGLLDVDPYIGRHFTDSEYASGDPVMLISHQAWAREFNMAPDILGRSIRTSTQNEGVEQAFTVIGVLPPDFHGTVEEDMPDLEFWIPINSYFGPEARTARDLRTVLVVGRLAEGARLAAARDEASAIAAALAPEFEALDDDHDYRVEPLGADWRAGFNNAGRLLGGAAGLLLAVAVLNVAMLLVARTMERRHELAVRAALGASRVRLVLPVLAEALLLSLAGGAIGLAAAGPLLDGFLALSGAQIPTYLALRPDAAVMAISFGLMLAAGVMAALLPAMAATKVDINDALREGSGKLAGSRAATRTGRWMVGGQIALTLALLLSGTLLGRSYLELEQRDLGFATENRLRMGLFINPSDVAEESELPAFVDRVRKALLAQPGVHDVAMLWPTLPMPYAIIGRVQWPGMPDAETGQGLQVSNYIVQEGFFGALEVPLVAGRTFDSRDADTDRRTAVIGRSLARRLGGPGQALDREITLNGTAYRVVGVVGDVMFGGPREGRDFEHEMYLSYAQLPRRVVSPIVHVDGDPVAYAEPLTRVLAGVAPHSAVDWVDPVDEFVGWLYRDSTFRLVLVAAFALSALALSSVGLYAVLAQQVTAATTEIGIRKALGSSDARILGGVARKGLAITLGGTVAGLLLALAFSRLLGGLLAGVSPFDPVAYAVTVVVMLAVALLASLLPARRAARVAPMEALRHE